MTLWWADVETCFGTFQVVSTEDAIVAVILPGEHPGRVRHRLATRFPGETIVEKEGGKVAEARRQLAEYCAGTRTTFDLPLDTGGTDFQQGVWASLRAIPHGGTVSYAELAQRVGRPGAARAVGQANRRNPLPVLVPCHRVVAADGSLGGYMGTDAPADGLKATLLRHEGAMT